MRCPNCGRPNASVCVKCDAPLDNCDVMQDDLIEMLGLVGLGVHARPLSPHQVVQQELIPRLKEMVAAMHWQAVVRPERPQ